VRDAVARWRVGPLILPVATTIDQAIGAALAREGEYRYEPIVLDDGDGPCCLIDIQVLLIEQCRLLTDALEEVARQREATRTAEREREELQRRFAEASRQAGMAEIASSILHNMGNVLNSVNVSVNVLNDKLRGTKVTALNRAVALLRQHDADLGDFLTADDKGRQLPGFIAEVGELLSEENRAMLDEIQALGRSVEPLSHIVTSQQSYATGTLATEPFGIRAVVEDAIRMNALALQRHHIDLVREYHDTPDIVTDKHLVMQILVNVLRNAKIAVRDSDSAIRRIIVTIEPIDSGDDRCIRVRVEDTGVGIAPENLAKIFNHGFTTRDDGHGIGLHNAANAAAQLGGSLSAESPGPGRGAVFTLTLPLTVDSPQGQLV